MPRIKYGQKTSTKLTRAEKQRISTENWRLINELRDHVDELKEAMERFGQDEVVLQKVRKAAKGLKLDVENVAVRLSKIYNVKIAKKYVKRVKLGLSPFDFKKPASALAMFFPNKYKGLLNSINNVMNAAPEGANYWMQQILKYTGHVGVVQLGYLWDEYYFDRAMGYDDKNLTFFHDYETQEPVGYSALLQIRDENENGYVEREGVDD